MLIDMPQMPVSHTEADAGIGMSNLLDPHSTKAGQGRGWMKILTRMHATCNCCDLHKDQHHAD